MRVGVDGQLHPVQVMLLFLSDPYNSKDRALSQTPDGPRRSSLSFAGKGGSSPDLEDPRKHLLPEEIYTFQQLETAEIRLRHMLLGRFLPCGRSS
jgi:hypothetical protein